MKMMDLKVMIVGIDEDLFNLCKKNIQLTVAIKQEEPTETNRRTKKFLEKVTDKNKLDEEDDLILNNDDILTEDRIELQNLVLDQDDG